MTGRNIFQKVNSKYQENIASLMLGHLLFYMSHSLCYAYGRIFKKFAIYFQIKIQRKSFRPVTEKNCLAEILSLVLGKQLTFLKYTI